MIRLTEIYTKKPFSIKRKYLEFYSDLIIICLFFLLLLRKELQCVEVKLIQNLQKNGMQKIYIQYKQFQGSKHNFG